MRKTLICLITLCAASFAMANEPMIRFELTESSNEGEPTEVKINLPLNMLAALGDQFDEALDDINLDGQEVDLRAIWDEVKNAGPNEYVRINSEEGTVVASTTGTHILVSIEEDDQKIEIKLPYEVAEILLGGDDPDTQSLIDALMEMRGENLLTIDGPDVQGRVWID